MFIFIVSAGSLEGWLALRPRYQYRDVYSEILLRAQEDCYDKEEIIANFILHGDQLTYF